MVVHTALEAAEALIRALGIRYGEVTVQAAAGEVTVVRRGETLKAPELAGMTVGGEE